MTYASFVPLPFELWDCIASHLTNADIKSLRLTCTQVKNAVPLRLDRVFLSANPLNIQVFRNIASHDCLRHSVTEIIWDEARLLRGPGRAIETDEGRELLSDEDEPNSTREWAEGYYDEVKEEINKRYEYEEESGCPKWFKDACEENIYNLRSRKGGDRDRPVHIACRAQILAQPPLRECWQHYQHLLRQQKDVLADDSDLEAFLFGVNRFPALKRVTITPAAHGNLFVPLYPTPMIRAFPKGFNYPIPRGWLYSKIDEDRPATTYPWNQYPELRERYRGFCTTMRVLANEPNSVCELVMTSNFLLTGINCMIFDEPCEEYDNFVKVLKTPGFRRLDISLLVGGEDEADLEPCRRSFLNGRLRHALSGAMEIEDFRLHTTLDDNISYSGEYQLIPLSTIIPVRSWSNLRHFELSSFVISQDDCMSFLGTLPKSIRSVELSMLEFLDGGTWAGMLEEIRRMVSEGTLWRDLATTCRPKITIGVSNLDTCPLNSGRGKWIEKEVHDFVCGGGENPFREPCLSDLQYGTGKLKDAFDPSFERPNVGPVELMRLNIRQKEYDLSKY